MKSISEMNRMYKKDRRPIKISGRKIKRHSGYGTMDKENKW